MDSETHRLLEQGVRSCLNWYLADKRSFVEEQWLTKLSGLPYIVHISRQMARDLLAYFWIDADVERSRRGPTSEYLHSIVCSRMLSVVGT